MISALVSSLDYKRTLSSFAHLDCRVTPEILAEHKMKDRDFMNIVKRGEAGLLSYLAVLQLRARSEEESKLLIDLVIQKEGFNSKAIQGLLHEADNSVSLENPFSFSSELVGDYLFYVPKSSVDMLCASALLMNCTHNSTPRNKKGVEERVFVFNDKLNGIFTLYHNLKKPAWAYTGRLSASVESEAVESWLKSKNLINASMVRINSPHQYMSLLKDSSGFFDESKRIVNGLENLGVFKPFSIF